MKVTVMQLLEALPALQTLGAAKLPAKSAYHVSRLVDALTPEIQRATEARIKLFREYGEERRRCLNCPELYDRDREACPRCGAPKGPDEATLVHQVKPQLEPAFRNEMEPLLTSSVEIERAALPLDLIESIEITAAEMRCLIPFLTNGE